MAIRAAMSGELDRGWFEAVSESDEQAEATYQMALRRAAASERMSTIGGDSEPLDT